MDTEPGRASDLIACPISCAHGQTDRFETLCHIHADISAAPSTEKTGSSGKLCYYREFDIVLMVGLTELKVQIRWTDSITVGIRESRQTATLTPPL